MRPITVNVGPLAAAVANSIALSQSLAGPGPVTLNGALVSGGVATLSPPAPITITSAGNDKGIFFTIIGVNVMGQTVGEQLQGSNTAATSQFVYAKVNSIVASGATASTITVGNGTGGVSQWIRLDEWADAPVGVQVSVSGTVSFTVQHSFDDPNDMINPVAPSNMFWDSSLVPAGAIGGTAGLTFSIATAPLWMKLLQNSGTGSAKMVVTQYNVSEG